VLEKCEQCIPLMTVLGLTVSSEDEMIFSEIIMMER
jgi:hypothetical protein